MGNVLYRSPLGQVSSLTEPMLEELIYQENAAYWQQGEGYSCIEIDGIQERLIFFLDDPHGFFIMRYPHDLAPYNNEVDIKIVMHRIGGETRRVPSCFYQTREKAYAILSDYIRMKSIPLYVEWVKTDGLDMHYSLG